MRLVLQGVEMQRGVFHLGGNGIFSPGMHLVWGPVGCGKTTLALLLAGLLSPHRGEVRKEQIERMGFLTQFPEYQVTCGSLAEEVESYGIESETVLRDTGLLDRRGTDPLSLSRGELKRLLLEAILHTDPGLLLLDEPFGGMDCQERGRLIRKIKEVSDRITILFTHDHGVLPRIDRLWEIEKGRLIDRGTMPEALRAWSSPPPFLLPYLENGIVPPYFSTDTSREEI
jgi:energy-coupling factor transporter ATP-binding protein EcfA2